MNNTQEYISLYLPLAGGVLVLAIILFVLFSKRSRKTRDGTEQRKSLPAEKISIELPQAKTSEPILEKSKFEQKPAASFKKAIASWVPLLKEKTKDRDRWEEVLVMSDMGPSLADELLDGLQKSEEEPTEFFRANLKTLLAPSKAVREPWKENKPWVCLVVGVNGVGKTTTIVKLGRYFKNLGKTAGVIGADTFRKAAIEQLERGCEKNSIDFFTHRKPGAETEGADPSAVVFDGLQNFKDKDVVFVDTSGRLHNKKNLMEELKKMKRTADKALPGAPHDTWLVVDATLGQNAIVQAKSFHDAVGLSGLILTKMDGLSRGGSVFQLYQDLQLPILFIGKGENASDIEKFDPDHFVDDLFDLFV